MNSSSRRKGRSREAGKAEGAKPVPTTRQAMEEDRNEVSNTEDDEDHCPVCLNKIHIFAFGMCNHHVCSECSTRLRVLCQQYECPICRQDMPKVIHAKSRHRFDDVKANPYKMDRKAKICFEDDQVGQNFDRLLSHVCPKCDSSHRTFEQLGKHVRKDHELFFCDICAKNIKLFTHERRLYDRKLLATHKRVGDKDDTSYRGHPMCKFCTERFLDNDELYRHLRKDHFFCHFCDGDGKQLYFLDYDNLRDHFAQEHFLCTEGNCVNEQFTSAFKTKIDLQAHRAEKHSSELSKQAARQNRIVGLDFNYARPNRQGDFASASDDSASHDNPPDWSSESFPTLGGAPEVRPLNPGGGAIAKRVALSSGHNSSNWSNGLKAPRDEDFPSLPGSSSAAPPLRPSAVKRQPLKAKPVSKPAPARREDDFPSLASQPNLKNFRAKQVPDSLYQDWNGAAASAADPVPMQSKITMTSAAPGPSPGAARQKPVKLTREDFPDLGGPKKANKSKSKASSGSSVSVDASLRSAADLIQSGSTNAKTNAENDAWTEVNKAKTKSQGPAVQPPSIPGLDRPPPGQEAYPSLGPASKKMTAHFQKSKENVSPAWNTQGSSRKQQPPGFEAKAMPPSNSKKYPYSQPQNFAKRNNQLLGTLMQIMGGGKSLEFSQFKEISGQFRAGSLSASDYYDLCMALMEANPKFLDILPEMLALLPDIKKQQDLYRAHMAKNQSKPLAVRNCDTCGQLLVRSDYDSHRSLHTIDSDFPVLG